MSGEDFERFVQVLNSTFSACDENETGFVEINRIIDYLISQDTSWQENETIREEFHKVLHGDLNYLISKEDFIKSLQGLFEAIQYQDKENKIEDNINEAGKCSSSTSGIGEPSDISSGSSTNSLEAFYSGRNFVSDEQIFTNEDLADEISLNDCGGSQEERLVKVLQSEISTLLRKNKYLENINESLRGQVSSLEESEDYKKQLIKTNERLEMQIQKHEETEDKINRFTEENKLITIQLSQAERENTKLKTMVSNLEIELENSSSETIEKTFKLNEVIDKYNTINELYKNSVKLLEQERENFRSKEKERENSWREVLEDTRNLQSQLDANTSYTEDIKLQLRAALKELSDIQSARIKNVMKTDSSASLLSADKSMVFLDGNLPLDSTIPFETSLLAELKDEVQSDKQECCCVCKQSVSLSPRPSDTVEESKHSETAIRTAVDTFI